MTGRADGVLVLGEALIDLVPVTGCATDESAGAGSGSHSGSGERELERAQPGGAPANVAVGLARLGRPVSFAGALGSDGFARAIERRLTDAGVDLSLCARPRLPTALAVAAPGPAGNGYHFHLESTATFQFPPREAESTHFGAVYAGGLAAVVEPAAGAVAATARMAARHSLLVVDPNVREDRTIDPARGHQLLRELCELAHVVKASDEDLRRLWPDTDPDHSCRKLAEEGRLVVLTRGDRGATAFVPGGASVSVPAVAVEVVNTIGAGDAFMAGVLAWLGTEGGWQRELSPDRAGAMLDFASQIAASVVTQTGTEPTAPAQV
ncbi:carbohydrate kinase family protein [Streptomyces lunaelactis]|uniref:carbohydrate kinase family protein n=1 Tax=Streptomyces lunaelactis TaxID=1535768 RepID=UPI0015858B88|nr:carbohydrate kinase [Streptomyces lunaelactis]NUK24772.1 carbohydrate kinase [Streptomyces lunaelactis]